MTPSENHRDPAPASSEPFFQAEQKPIKIHPQPSPPHRKKSSGNFSGILLLCAAAALVGFFLNTVHSTDKTPVAASSESVASSESEELLTGAAIYPIADNPLEISAYGEAVYTAEAASFQSYSGAISDAESKNIVDFTAPLTGCYRFELSGMDSGFSVSMVLCDAAGNTVDYSHGIANGYGLTVSLEAGQTYTLSIESWSGTGTYDITVGLPKNTADLSPYTTVQDAIAFQDQEINYQYTPALDGIYRFEITQINHGVAISLFLYDAAGYEVDRILGIGQGDGISVALNAGQTYRLLVKQRSDSGSYTMRIGPQQPTVDISSNTLVTDSIQYQDQRNLYCFTAQESGTYRFQIDKINSGVAVSLFLYDEAGYELGSNTHIGQGYGITVTLNAGQTYQLQVRQASDLGAYTMSVGAQKPVIDISPYAQVQDSIQYTDQVNVYTYQPASTGTYTFAVSGMPSDLELGLSVYDEGNYTLASGSWMRSDSSTAADLEAGKTYTIQVRYQTGYGDYTLDLLF